MNKYIKIDNAYINTAYITSVTDEQVGSHKIGDEWIEKKLVFIRTIDGTIFYFNGTIDDAIELINGKGDV
jgi:hypothetical protein